MGRNKKGRAKGGKNKEPSPLCRRVMQYGSAWKETDAVDNLEPDGEVRDLVVTQSDVSADAKPLKPIPLMPPGSELPGSKGELREVPRTNVIPLIPMPNSTPETFVAQLLDFGQIATTVRSVKEMPREYAETLAFLLREVSSGQKLFKSVKLASLYDIMNACRMMAHMVEFDGGTLLALHRKAVCALVVYLGMVFCTEDPIPKMDTEYRSVLAYIGQILGHMVQTPCFHDWPPGIQRIATDVLRTSLAEMVVLEPDPSMTEAEQDTLEELNDVLMGSSLVDSVQGKRFRERVMASKEQLAAARAKCSADQFEMMLQQMKAGDDVGDEEAALADKRAREEEKRHARDEKLLKQMVQKTKEFQKRVPRHITGEVTTVNRKFASSE